MRRRRDIGALAMAASLVGLAACTVTNPGPVADENLNLSTVHQALVNGSGRQLSEAVSFIGYTGALAAREILAGGQTGNGGHDPVVQAGNLPVDNSGLYGHWNYANQSRWIAEDAARRFATLGDGKVDPGVYTQAYLWAGYANRLLGENYCEAVFDGGGKQPNSDYFKRAETAFTNAIAKAPATTDGANQKTAAYAGRASVRVYLKDWAGAVSDAGQVPLAFNYFLNADNASQDTRNQIYFVNSNNPYRGYTIWDTWFQTYYDQTGDPRVPYGKNPLVPSANSQLSGYGSVPWYFQTKYLSNDSDFKLSSGREMVLIKAEAALTNNDLAGAMTLINSIRTTLKSDKTGATLAPWVANNITDGWTFLKRERRIEMWLEARALGDIRRWKENNTPGVLDWPNFEALTVLFTQNPASVCFPVPQSEIDTNPNF